MNHGKIGDLLYTPIIEQWIRQTGKTSDIKLAEYQRLKALYSSSWTGRENIVGEWKTWIAHLDGWAPQIITIDDPYATETDCDEISWEDLEAILNGR